MPESALLAAGLAFLVPLGYALIGVGGLPEDRARHAVLGLLAALGLAILGYLAVGFGLQFGGIGLLYNQPGYEQLVWEWSGIGTTWGVGWGMAGLSGWGLSGTAATIGAYALAFANLPWVATAAVIPLLSLRGRIPGWATAFLALLVGAVVYPLAGNWIWGGGWLANLGANLGMGHGYVDVGGSGLVHLLGAAVALAGILVFLPRLPRANRNEPVALPPVHLPVLATFGAGLLLAGSVAWSAVNPLLDRQSVSLLLLALNTVVAAAAGALLPLLYTWFVAGRPDPLMATRGLAAGSIIIAAAAPFVPPWVAFVLGACAGILVTLVIYLVDHVARIDDPTAAGTVHGLGGALGLLALGIFADGRFGRGWNGIGTVTYLGVPGQGVTGWLAAPGFQPDWPGQAQAQVVGLVAIVLLGFFAAWLVLAPLSALQRALTLPRPPRTEPALAPSMASTAYASDGVAPLGPDEEPGMAEAPGPAPAV